MDKERLIANYFLDALSDDEKIQFESCLKTDPDFKDEFEFQKSVKQAILKKEHENLKQSLQHFESKIKAKKLKKVWWPVAASIILLVSLGLYFFSNDISHDKLFAEFYEPAKNIVHPIVRTSNDQEVETIAFIAYQKQDYKLAQELFQSVYISTKKSELLFYEGIALIELNQTKLAIQKLKEHKAFNDVLSDKTNWYLALAYLKDKDILNAQTVLGEIISDASAFKYKEAKSLLKKL